VTSSPFIAVSAASIRKQYTAADASYPVVRRPLGLRRTVGAGEL